MITENDTAQGESSGADGKTTANDIENGVEDQPPQKKKRLSNREYKKLMKGQNKVSHLTILLHQLITHLNVLIFLRLDRFHSV